jgi:hypothetical protein
VSAPTLLVALRWGVCDEEVTRKGESQPCEKTAVALRYDPEEQHPYPVCAYHSRRPMVPLAAIVTALAGDA